MSTGATTTLRMVPDFLPRRPMQSRDNPQSQTSARNDSLNTTLPVLKLPVQNPLPIPSNGSLMYSMVKTKDHRHEH